LSERPYHHVDAFAIEPGTPPECSIVGWFCGNGEQAWRGSVLLGEVQIGTLTCGTERADVLLRHPDLTAPANFGFVGHFQLPSGLLAGEHEITLSFSGRWGRELGEIGVPITLHTPVPILPARPELPQVDHGHPGAAYLDLMAKSLLGLPYASDSESLLRQDGRDWPANAHTMVGESRLSSLRACVETALREQVPGDMVETGVWKGGACILMRAVLRAYGDQTRKVWLADSFAGLPLPDPIQYPADAGDIHHLYPDLAVPLEAVRENFRRYSLLDDRVMFLKGWFEDTLPAAPISQIAVLRLDGDMYSSTMTALTNLYPKLVPGGFCIVDDYGAVPACRKAVQDYRAAHGITEPVTMIDWTGCWWRKAGDADSAPSIVATASSAAVSIAPLSISTLPEMTWHKAASIMLPIPVGGMLTREPHLLTGVSAWQQHIPFAFWLVEHLRPRTIVELGVHTGPSYCALCQAVVETGLDARCYGVDTWLGDAHAGQYGDEIFASLSRYHDPIYSGFSTLIRGTFEAALTHFEDGSIDLLHIDGAHFYDDVKRDFTSWLPKVSSRGLILFHDTNVRERDFGVARLWSEIHRDYPSFQFYHGHGLGVLCVGESLWQQFAQWFGIDEHQAVVRRLFATLGSRLPLRAKLESSHRVTPVEMPSSAGPLRDPSSAAVQSELRAVNGRIAAQEHLWQSEKDLLLAEMQKETLRTKRAQRRILGGSSIPLWKGFLLLATRRHLRKKRSQLAASGLFSETWYLSQLPKSIHPADPLLHYLLVGWKLGLSPHQLFDVPLYLERYSKKLKGREPLGDFVTRRAKPGRHPHLLFDTDWYSRTQLKQGDATGNLLGHYLAKGAAQNLCPHPLFDGTWYRQQYAGDIPPAMTPLEHYLDSNNSWKFQPNEWFNSRWYGKQHLGDSRAYATPLHHYLELGGRLSLSTHPDFDAKWYRRTHMTAADKDAKRSPLEHLLRVGLAKGYGTSEQAESGI
jgi:O-methyltransferase